MHDRSEAYFAKLVASTGSYHELNAVFGLLKGGLRARSPEVHWHDGWHPSLDEALSALPSPELCPPELLREIFEVCTVEKRVALVGELGNPLAVVPLKRAFGMWQPVTTWVLPGTLFPARAGQEIRALAALRMPIFVGWWRQRMPPPDDAAIAQRRDVPAHRLACTEEDEPYWRQTGLLNKVRRARKRCATLRVEVNRPGAAQWTIENWGRSWASEGHACVPDTLERLTVARWWEPHGRHVCVSLLDGDEIAASATAFVQDRDVIGLSVYRRREYDRLLVSTRLFDAVHQWALGSGMALIDFGSDHDYKKEWAPQAGTKSELVVDVPPSFAFRAVRAVKAPLRASLGRGRAS